MMDYFLTLQASVPYITYVRRKDEGLWQLSVAAPWHPTFLGWYMTFLQMWLKGKVSLIDLLRLSKNPIMVANTKDSAPPFKLFTISR